MSLEHSPARERKRGSASPFAYELLTRDELAERLHVTATTVTRSYAKWGLRPVRVAGRILFPSDQILELERRAMTGELEAPKPIIPVKRPRGRQRKAEQTVAI
jgi:hypothetical protein